VLSNVLKQKDIFRFFSRSAMDKAWAYRAQRRVAAVEINDDCTNIRARVTGSAQKPYAVDIDLRYSGDGLIDIEGECTCPMSHNCKHVAATLLEATSARTTLGHDTLPSDGRTVELKATPSVSALPAELNDWLEKIGTAVRGDDYPPEVMQRLIYCVQALPRDGQILHLALSVISTRLRKDGGFSNQFSRPNLSSFNLENPPVFYRAADIDIVRSLLREYRSYGQHDVYLVRNIQLLQHIVGTGRAYWRDLNGVPMRWGEIRSGHVEWRQTSQKGIAPHLLVEGAVAMAAEPPVYFDEAAGLVGPVETRIPANLAYRILSAPLIPRAQVAEVARRLGQRLPAAHHDLLPAPPASAIKIDTDPTPVLHLLLRQAPYAYFYNRPERMPLAHLSFRYGPVVIEPSEKAKIVEVFYAGQVHEVARRLARERDASKHLVDVGFIPAMSLHPFLDIRHRRDLTFREPHDWFDFLRLHADDLRQQGFEIRVDDDFPYRLAESSDAIDMEFESSGIDWFELGLGIEIDGERRDITSILAALVSTPNFTADEIKRLAESGNHFYLSLSDGRHVSLAADRFLPLVLALHTLSFYGSVAGESGKIRLSQAGVVPLLALESEGLAFKGDGNLRRLVGLLQTRGLASVDMPPGFKAALRPYQAQGVAWLDLLREAALGGVLADDMGLGKTVQMLALLALEKSRGNLSDPALVISPTSLTANWFNEIQKFTPDLRVLVLHGPNRRQNFAAIPHHDVVLTTYPLVARDHEVLLSREWHMAILDEAQTIKNPVAATTRWLRGIKARHRFCLTGTPMENHLGELWSIMTFANPGYLGDKAAFARHWRTPIEKQGNATRAAALARRVKPFLLRRTKGEVATDLPPKSEIIESVVLEAGQRDLYDSIRLSMSQKVRKAIRDRGLAKSHIIVLEALLKLRQVCCHPALLGLDDGVERPAAKLDRLMEMLLELLSEGRKIIVFSQFTSMLALIRARFDERQVRYSLLTGQTKDRKSIIDGFQGGASDVFLISLKAGGVGLNLTAADTVIVFDPWWNPAVEEQAIDRAHRIGQDKAVFVYRLVAAGTIEEKMDELKARKRALSDGLFDRDGSIASALTEEDVKALFEV
jgi:superfamily II DNA or RNA helicase